jgi:hypothetical protein
MVEAKESEKMEEFKRTRPDGPADRFKNVNFFKKKSIITNLRRGKEKKNSK